MLLQLDPDDNEAEQKIRAELDGKVAADIGKALGKQQAFLRGQMRQYEDPVDWFRRDFERDMYRLQAMQKEDLADMTMRGLTLAVDLGVGTASAQMERIGLFFDFTLAHTDARAWASQYNFDLINGLSQTTETLLRQAITDWIANGLPLKDLLDQLEPIFGEKRAEMIGVTEITRAFAMGTLAGYKAAGYGEGNPTEVPPLHPRCRCWLSLQLNDDGSADFIFLNSMDERVCPRCGPLGGQVVGRAKGPDPVRS